MNTLNVIFEAFLTAVVTLGATFLGAKYAFHLEDNARARKTVRDQVAAVNEALFVLARQFNSLHAIQKQIINPDRDIPRDF